ncbi:MAG: sugar ABC transporter permease, partial [Prevotella sp.]|nr:sugar ABC transporter permease [Prevotella sp.]
MSQASAAGKGARARSTLREMRENYLAYIFIAPFMICFLIFVVGPVVSATLLSFTSYESIQAPRFVGFHNFIKMLTQDVVLMKYVIPNTVVFAVV